MKGLNWLSTCFIKILEFISSFLSRDNKSLDNFRQEDDEKLDRRVYTSRISVLSSSTACGIHRTINTGLTNSSATCSAYCRLNTNLSQGRFHLVASRHKARVVSAITVKLLLALHANSVG